MITLMVAISASLCPSYADASMACSDEISVAESPGIVVLPKARLMLDCPVVPDVEDYEIKSENDELELNWHSDEEKGVRCRICHSDLEENAGEGEASEEPGGVKIDLGCQCKGELGVAHKRCAETWFKIKGNIVCEICDAAALNVVLESGNEGTNVVNIPMLLSSNSNDDSNSHGNEIKHAQLMMTCLITLTVFSIFAFVIGYIYKLKKRSGKA